jgi:glutaredoxin
MQSAPIIVFTKPDCTYCARAKTVLQKQGIDYREFDVTTNNRNASASVYFSGVSSVPQIFIGTYHINGAEDLERLQAIGKLDKLLTHTQGQALPLDTLSDQELHWGAEDWVLREVIPQSDGSRSDDPETWPILRFYKEFFGFWPNTFAYLHHWPDAYKLFVYCHNFSAVGLGKEGLGPVNMFAVGYSTSNAHGCSYCQVHSAATGGDASLNVVKQYRQALAGKGDEDNPFGELELAIANLAADATRNEVKPDHLTHITQQAQDAPTGQGYIQGTEMMVAAFGFLNVFNDLTGLEVEGQWAEQAQSQTDIGSGRHGAQASNPNNLDYDLPQGGPSIEEMLNQYDQTIPDLHTYADAEFGLLPQWMQLWPEPLRKRHAYLYGELMGQRQHTLLSPELKHLMARVSAIAKDHDYLAAIEGFMAHHAAKDKTLAVERVRHCFAAATGRTPYPDLFDKREQAALHLAWLSAQMPLTTPRRFVQSAVEVYSPKELVHLIVVCAIASMVQRFVAIAQPAIEPEVQAFLNTYGLETDGLKLRYPIPAAS